MKVNQSGKNPNLLLMTLLSIGVASCAGKGGGSSSKTAAPVVAAAAGGAPTILTFQGAAPANWRLDSSKRAWTASRTLHITGKCVAKVYAIRFTDKLSQQTLGKAAICQADQSFEWVATVSQDGELRLILDSVDTSGNSLPGELIQSVVVDTTAPAPPVITTNGGIGFVSSTPRVIVVGTVNGGSVVMLQTNGNQTVPFDSAAGSFSQTFELVSGESRIFTFWTLNFVGTRSEPARISIAYLPGFALNLFQVSALRSDVAMTVASPEGYRLLNGSLSPFTAYYQPTAGVSSNLTLWTGLTQITGPRHSRMERLGE